MLPRAISIHSFRRGTGKSRLTINLAALLATQGERVGIVDTDIQAPSMSALLNPEHVSLTYTLNDYLQGHCEIEQAAYEIPLHNAGQHQYPITLVPASTHPRAIAQVLHKSYNLDLLETGFRKLIHTLALDTLLIDTHAGLNEETLLTMAVAESVLIVMCPDQQHYQGTAVTLDVARKLDVPRVLMIINQIPDEFDMQQVQEQVEKTYECPVAAVLPHSDTFIALASGHIFALEHPEHVITQQLKRAVERLQKSY